MRRIRQTILDGSFAQYKDDFLAAYQPVPEANRQTLS
jgi:queuine/archaeosine tRNA-ribosyltransferase